MLSGVHWAFPDSGRPCRDGRDRHAGEGSESGKQNEDHQGAAVRRTLGTLDALMVEGARPAVRAQLDGLMETTFVVWVFSGNGSDEPLDRKDLRTFWTRAAAGIVADARLHGVRHAHASPAVPNGKSLHVEGCQRGQRWSGTTNRYVHLDDATPGEADKRVVAAIARKLRHAGGSRAAGAAARPTESTPDFTKLRRITTHLYTGII